MTVSAEPTRSSLGAVEQPMLWDVLPRTEQSAVEAFRVERGAIKRSVVRRSGGVTDSVISVIDLGDGPVSADDADAALLRLDERPPVSGESGTISIVDLFSGSGGLTLGVSEAARATGHSVDTRAAADLDPVALQAYVRNFPAAKPFVGDVSNLLDGRIGAQLTQSERELRDAVGRTTFLLGGPPCEGHSAFNNRSRHVDSRNELYLRMVRAAEVLEPEHVLIENVPGALRDRSQVVQRSIDHLHKLGYSIGMDVVSLLSLGVPQSRRRLLVVGSRSRQVDVSALEAIYRRPPRTVAWAIGDLVAGTGDRLVDQAAVSAPVTRRRIAHLFDNDLYELPNAERPACHAAGNHSYKSIYGRLRMDAPAQTITSGFYSMCMGRYVHPTLPRTITAHEAARLQFIPDYFDLSTVTKRGKLAQLIGDAVPLKLGYVSALELLR